MSLTPKYKVGDKLYITASKEGSTLVEGDIVTVAFVDYGDPNLTYKSSPHPMNEEGSWFSENRCRPHANNPGEDCIF